MLKLNACNVLLPLACVAAVSILAGCGGSGASDIPPLQPVRGVVTLDGKPLENATIVFVPKTGPSSGAVTNAEGEYVMQNRSGAPGAVAGPAQVMITTATVDPSGKETPELLPAKYNAASTLEVDIQEGENQKNFELTSK